MLILLTSDTIVNFGTDAGGVSCKAGTLQDVPERFARALVLANRACYTKASDDPKKGIDTASAEVLKAAKALEKTQPEKS